MAKYFQIWKLLETKSYLQNQKNSEKEVIGDFKMGVLKIKVIVISC